MCSPMKLYNTDHTAEVNETMLALQHKSKLCDVTLVMGNTATAASIPSGKTSSNVDMSNASAGKDKSSPNSTSEQPNHTGAIECHKVVLAAASPYFMRKFCSEEAEGNLNMVNVPVVEPRTIEHVLCFMYTGQCDISDDTVDELQLIARKWEMEKLLVECQNYMLEKKSVNNAVTFYEICKRNENEKMLDVLSVYIRENFKAVVEANQVIEFSHESLLSILRLDEINVTDEDIIFKAVVQWIEAHPEHTDTTSLLKIIRFEGISGKFLVEQLQDHPLMQKPFLVHAIRDAIKKLFRYGEPHLTRFWQNDMHNSKLVFVTKEKQVVKLFNRNKVVVNLAIPNWIDQSTFFANSGTLLLFCGSSAASTNSMFIMDCFRVNFGVSKITLPEKLSSVSFVPYNDVLFIFGGKKQENKRIRTDSLEQTTKTQTINTNQDQIYQANLHTGESILHKVENCTLKEAVSDAVTIEYDKKIYILGGNNNKQVVQVFNPKTLSVELCSNLPTTCNQATSGAVIYQDKLHVITPTVCMIYDNSHDRWQQFTYTNSLGECVKPFVCAGRIIGCVYQKGTCCIMSYDLGRNVWQDEEIDVSDCWMPKFMGVY